MKKLINEFMSNFYYNGKEVIQKIMEMDKQVYLENLDKDDLYSILKYGLRNSNAPSDVTVEDIYYVIQCNPL